VEPDAGATQTYKRAIGAGSAFGKEDAPDDWSLEEEDYPNKPFQQLLGPTLPGETSRLNLGWA